MTDTTAEQNELDSWAEAMAEQEATTQNPDTAVAAETTVEQEPAAGTNNSVQDGAFPGTKNASATVFKQFSNEGALTNTSNDIDLILDIPVQLTVELGRTKIAIKNLLQLAQGSVVELDGLAGEPMDVLVNGCLIAQGEVVVVNDKFGIRLTDIITPSERIRKLNR
ncbi:flagellar motor switch protein FliN/FliY [Nitrosomonas sp. Nm51]|uniref:flagellar motor switch protein FliN n=1 Tax=Nitrosomonas sp. Nm51 TaxID=133720 RepID=UPI0008B41B32|nr:flagellar motor switch protein FliN [Nitrosomonas sp. Nm51]SER20309.1 flagellar motor switch protein FliN/FliY [Nitrosomonas sp. Nm51]